MKPYQKQGVTESVLRFLAPPPDPVSETVTPLSKPYVTVSLLRECYWGFRGTGVNAVKGNKYGLFEIQMPWALRAPRRTPSQETEVPV